MVIIIYFIFFKRYLKDYTQDRRPTRCSPVVLGLLQLMHCISCGTKIVNNI